MIAAFALDLDAHDRDLRRNGERYASEQQYASSRCRRAGSTARTGGKRTALLGQGMGNDPNPIWQLEFWNRSIEYFMGLDGSAGAGQRAPEPRQDRRDARAPDLDAE